jgi:nitrate reductase NapAB chaperone NapD
MDTLSQITLQQRVDHAIVHNPHLSSCNIHFHADDAGKLVIVGQAQSFFAKQMAQEVLRNVEGVEAIENGLTVDW